MTESTPLPLDGIKVLDMSRVLAGPYCALLLSHLGAEVIKIENLKGDETRAWPPFTQGISDCYMAVNINKRGIAIDLKTPEGAGIAKELAERSDVLVENFKTGTMERFGLGYDELKRLNPGLLFASITAFGSTGPRAGYPGYETLMQGYSGIMSFTGEPGGGPVRSGVSFLDLSSGILAALGVVSTLYRRKESGRGARIEGSLLQSAISLMSLQLSAYFQSGAMPQPRGSAHPAATPYQAFPTADGHVLIAAANQNLWEKTARALGLEGMIADGRFKDNPARMANMEQFVSLMSDATRQWETAPIVNKLVEAGVPSCKINDFDDLMADGQVEALGAVMETEEPDYGRLRAPAPPWLIDGTSGKSGRNLHRAPKLGEHTREILAGLDYGGERIEELIAKGVVVTE